MKQKTKNNRHKQWLWAYLFTLLSGYGCYSQAQNTFIKGIDVLENGSVALRFTLASSTRSYTIWRDEQIAIHQGYSATDNSFTDNDINANAEAHSYYINATLSNGNSENSQVWSSTFLLAQDNNNGTANLQWNNSYPPNRNYSIWKHSSNNNFTLIAQTTEHSYIDTIGSCQAEINYKISYTVGTDSCSSNIAGQLFKNQSPPSNIIPRNISIDNEQSAIYMEWEQPPATDTDIVRYKIWQINALNQSDTKPIKVLEGIMPCHTTLQGEQICDSSIVLAVTAEDSCGNSSVWMPELFFKTLTLHTPTYNPCTQTCHIDWEAIPPWYQAEADGVRLYQSVNQQSFELLAELPTDSLSYTIENIAADGTDYRFFIDSYNQNLGQSSRSCIRTLNTTAATHLDTFWISKATVLNGNTYIHWHSRGDSSHIAYFNVQNSKNGNLFHNIGNSITNSDNNYMFKNPEPATYLSPQSYRIQAFDSCHNMVEESSIATTIFAKCELNNRYAQPSISIYWTPYQHLENIRYQVYQTYTQNSSPILIYELEAETIPLEYDLDIAQANANSGKNGYSFYVEALGYHPETPDRIDTVRSNICFLPSTSKIVLPNAFNPRGTYNHSYQPLCYNIQSEGYYFVVIDQNNQVIFESHKLNDSWDGKINGEIAPSGSSFIIIAKGKDKHYKQVEAKGIVVVL